MQSGNLLDIWGAIEAIATLLSVIVAVVALKSSKRVEKETIRREQEFAAASIKPLLAIHTDDYEDLRSVILANHGAGTAIMTDISISKEGLRPKDNNLSELMYRNKEIKFFWDDYSYFKQEREYLRAGDKIYLVKLSEEHLINQEGLTDVQVQELLAEWEKQLSSVKIHISYEDMFGNKQPDCERLFP